MTLKAKQFWKDFGYEQVQTEDLSPSLKSLASEKSEIMHHRGGALSESRLVYGRVIDLCFENVPVPTFYSLGLGLGYNEALVAERALLAEKNFRLMSDEHDPLLIEAFLDYLSEKLPSGEIFHTYDLYFSMLKNPEKVRQTLLRHYEQGLWKIRGPLGATTMALPFSVNGFFWDAFSQKTSPDLWEENFLTQFFSQNADPEFSTVGTYACVGKLKRALKASGFQVEVCPGFQGKRNSTWAARGMAVSPFIKRLASWYPKISSHTQ